MHLVVREEAHEMADDERGGDQRSDRPGRRESDERSSMERDFNRMQWLLGIFVVVFLALSGYNSAQLNGLGTRMDKFIEGQTRNEERIAAIQREYGNRLLILENQMKTQLIAYNFHFANRLAVVEVKSGIEPKELPKE